MKKQEREGIRRDYFESITKKSWTFAKLTETEKKRCEEALFSYPILGDTRAQVSEQVQALYYAFLLALGYGEAVAGWRKEATK